MSLFCLATKIGSAFNIVEVNEYVLIRMLSVCIQSTEILIEHKHSLEPHHIDISNNQDFVIKLHGLHFLSKFLQCFF